VLDEPPGGGNLVANNTQKSEGGNLIEFITDAALRVVAARGRIGGCADPVPEWHVGLPASARPTSVTIALNK